MQVSKQTSSVYRLLQDFIVMANCNPVMGWIEDAELHKRYVEWREEVELDWDHPYQASETQSSLTTYSDGLGSQLETISRVSQSQSSNMREPV